MLDVIDFYSNNKLKIHPKFNKSLSEGDIILLLDLNNHKKEILVHIPKKYCYKRYWLSSLYSPKKAHEFNLLTDYLYETKKEFKKKNNLSEADFEELALSLKSLMNKKYINKRGVKELKALIAGEWELFKFRLKRIWSE